MATEPIPFPMTPDQIARLHAFAKQSGKPESQVLDDLLDAVVPQVPPVLVEPVLVEGEKQRRNSTLHDRLAEVGMLGCLDGPGDINTNPKYMKGFGESK